MGMTLKLSDEKDLDRFAFDLTSLHMKYDRWLQTTANKIVEEEVMIPIWESMRAHGYSQKIIDGTEIDVIIRRGKKVTGLFASAKSCIPAEFEHHLLQLEW